LLSAAEVVFTGPLLLAVAAGAGTTVTAFAPE
jgi:hypothetical protein